MTNSRAPAPAPAPAKLLKSISRFAGRLLLGLLVTGMSAWGVLAIYYGNLESNFLRTILAMGFGLCGLGTLIALASSFWRRVLAGFLVLFGGVVIWWTTIEASHDREWEPEVAVLPYATIEGDLVTVHNIRNLNYRSETDFSVAYYDKTFDLRKLNSVDLIASYWMGPTIAHIFLSFGFEGDDYLAISIETRKERGEAYSTLAGFFKQYELFYVVADERDVIRLRTSYRDNPPEDVYLYPVHGPIENGRRLFLEYMRKINALKDEPEFYNTLTTNCTTSIWLHSRMNPGHLPFSWKLLLSGYVPEYLYEAGRLDTSLPFSELKQRSRINARARKADNAEDFSRRIRE